MRYLVSLLLVLCASTAFALPVQLDSDANGKIDDGFLPPTLPSQATHIGKFLTTNGSAAAWEVIDLGTDTAGNYVASATASGGLVMTGTEGGSLGMLTTCGSGQVLKWNASAWACADDTGGDLVNDTTPQLGGDLDTNEKSILIDAAPTDNTAHGLIINDTIAESVIACDSLFLHSDGSWYQTDSNVEAEVKAVQGLATADGTGAHTANVLLNGICKNVTDLAYATIGAVLYAPETVGAPTTTIPADTGDFVRVLGYVINTDTIYFNPSPNYLER